MITGASTVATAAGDAFEKYPHWQTSSHQEQEVRRAFYKSLIDAGVDGVSGVAKTILKMLKRATQ